MIFNIQKKILPLNVSGKDQTETEVIETETKPQPSLPVVTAVIKAFSEEVKLLTLKTTVSNLFLYYVA